MLIINGSNQNLLEIIYKLDNKISSYILQLILNH